MPYDRKNVITSERPYDVLRELSNNIEEGSYATEIADTLDSNQQNISEIINNLEKVGLVEKGKRTRAQYYRVSPEGAFDLFLRLWLEKLEGTELEGAIKRDLEKAAEEFDNGPGAIVLLYNYINRYTQSIESSTIEKMLVEDFYDDLEFIVNGVKSPEVEHSNPDYSLDKELPEIAEFFYNLLSLIESGEKLDSRMPLYEALSDYEKVVEENEEL